jgi:hypothetical protein
LGAGAESGTEAFGLDCHDLSLENIFVDDNDHSKIVRFILFYSFSSTFLTRSISLDMHYRLGVDHNAPSVGMCASPSLSSI